MRRNRVCRVPKWKTTFKGMANTMPTSRKDWNNKPHFSRLLFCCVCFLVGLLVGLAFLAVMGSLDTDECSSDTTNDCHPLVRDPTTWTISQQDGPNHLGLCALRLPART